MNFLDMGIGEILLILLVALIIFGPSRIPEIARMLGRAVSALRRASFDLTTQIKKELEEEEKAPHSQSRTGSSDIVQKTEVADKTLSNDKKEAKSED